jgi:tRNA isopentenyl-2-thiomethyl-A-37 hydroxylase MiaE
MDKPMLQTLIKNAMKAELDSVTLYRLARENAEDADVVAFLEGRITEEKSHYNYLVELYRTLDAAKSAADLVVEIPECCETVSPVISEECITRVAGNQVLFSAFSMAALLEKQSMEFYRDAAERSESSSAKAFFQQMMKWESSHYDDVLTIQKEAELRFWQQNRFEPF